MLTSNLTCLFTSKFMSCGHHWSSVICACLPMSCTVAIQGQPIHQLGRITYQLYINCLLKKQSEKVRSELYISIRWNLQWNLMDSDGNGQIVISEAQLCQRRTATPLISPGEITLHWSCGVVESSVKIWHCKVRSCGSMFCFSLLRIRCLLSKDKMFMIQ